jgi:glutamyl-tRNA reductase
MSGPGLFVSGATHQTAPLAMREKLSPGPDPAELHGRLTAIPGVRELALLSTCNRLEIYAVADDPAALRALEDAFCAHRQLDPEDFGRVRMTRRDRDAIRHLFGVAAGLESQMVGENEILGQVKDAYAAAQALRSTGPVLNRLFQKTFQAAKLARSQTAITEGHVSVANVAVDLASNIFGALGGVRVLVLGAGDIAEKTTKAFLSRGAAPAMTVASRTIERASDLASRIEGDSLPLAEVESRLKDFDVVVGSTSAPGTLISAAAVRQAMHQRPSRPLFFIDLAMPRDIDPEVARLENVFLYNLDDLAAIAEKNLAARTAEVARCRELLQLRVEALWSQLEHHLGPGAAGRENTGSPAPGGQFAG